MFCKNCGIENPDGASFCRVCGSALAVAPVIEASADPVAETPVEPTVETPVQPASAPAAEGETAPKVTAVDPGKGMGVAALVLGIIGLVTGTVCNCGCACTIFGVFISGPIAILLAIVGLILGIIGMKKSKTAGFKNTMALVGIILSGIALASGVISLVIGILSFVPSFMEGFMEGFEQGYNGTYYNY